jgi:hypothetical protein
MCEQRTVAAAEIEHAAARRCTQAAICRRSTRSGRTVAGTSQFGLRAARR